jgi:hypothetical protein
VSLSPPELLDPDNSCAGETWRCEHGSLCGPDDYCDRCERQAALEDADGLRHRALEAMDSARDLLREAADRLEGYGGLLIRNTMRGTAAIIDDMREAMPPIPEEGDGK